MWKAIGAGLLLSLFVAGSAGAEPAVKGNKLVGSKAPLFATTDADGGKFVLEERLGRNRGTLINFWGLRCAPCIEEIPYLNAIAVRYKDKGIAIYGVNVDGVDSKTLREHIGKVGLDFKYTVLSDEDMKIVDLYGMTAAPATVFIDRDGIVRHYKEDFVAGDETKIEDAVKELLAR